MAKIGLLAIDGLNGFPNFALMRISSYHKSLGDQVEWATIFEEYDKLYYSKIFTFSPMPNISVYRAKEFIGGGYWHRHQENLT